MQREGRTSMPDVDNFDPNVDPGEGPVTQEAYDDGVVTGVETPPPGTSGVEPKTDSSETKAKKVVESYA